MMAGNPTLRSAAIQIREMTKQIKALQDERNKLRAALKEIARKAPSEKPIEPLVDFKNSREEKIVGDYLVWGQEIMAWIVGKIAKEALKDERTPRN